MPWRFGRYPRIDAATLRERLALFGVDLREDETDELLSDYLDFRKIHSNVAKRSLILAGVALMIAYIPSAGGFGAVFAAAREWVVWTVMAATLLVVQASEVWTRNRTPGFWHRTRGAEESARHRFFLRAGMTFASGYHVVVTQNLIGLAARQLFVSLQRRRWTWTSPPAVADRALRLTQPLLDIAVDDADGKAIFSFLNDVVVLVVAGREDLIPEVRARYTMIPTRTGEISDRDILYLDPMRNRGRWEVVKDFVLPLASWISLVVSIVALLVAVAK
jgi:hypothetical protein